MRVVRTAVAAPFAPAALRELLFCAIGAVSAVAGIGTVFAIPLALLALVRLLPGSEVVLLVLLLLAPRIARGLGAVQRWLAGTLLGESIPAPPPVPRRWGVFGWLAAGLRDPAGWRALAYLLVKLPVAVFDGYAAFCWVAGLVNLSYPLWWRLFRNHPPQVHLDPVPVATPFGSFRVGTFPGPSSPSRSARRWYSPHRGSPGV